MTKQTPLLGLPITVLYNKPAARFMTDSTHIVAEEDTEESAQEIANALAVKGMVPTLVPITEQDSKKVIEKLPDHLVFNLIEWTGIDTPYAIKAYEYMHAKGLFYTGAGLDTYLLSCDKSVMKARLEEKQLPTARWR